MPERRPRALLADNHPMLLLGLADLLEPRVEVAGTAADGRALLAAAELLQPDLVITEIAKPGFGGIEAMRQLQVAVPGVKVLVLSIHTESFYVRAAFEAGARGYLAKTSTPEEMERAICEVLANRIYLSPAVTRGAIEQPACRPQSPGTALTFRERAILCLLAQGLGNKQIAQRLNMALSTVRTHLNNLYEKLRLESRVELALYASQAGVLAH
jgi:DNA-binding NarL/FixJ family response regulator